MSAASALERAHILWHADGVLGHKGAVAATCFVLALPLSACAGTGGEAACALAFDFAGHSYYPHEAASPIQTGASLGQVANISCRDGDESGAPEHAEAFSIPGVDPAVAFAVPATGKRNLFVAGSPDRPLPAEVRRALGR